MSRKTSSYLSVTPMMVRNAVEELEKRRERVPIALLLTHFQRHFPVECNAEQLKSQLIEQADKAVKKGWLIRYSDNTYALANLRWEATVQEFGFD